MSTLTIKNVPGHLHRELKQSAVENHRSLNSEVIVRLEQALHKLRIDADAWIMKTSMLRKAVKNVGLTDEKLAKAKNEGRS